MGTLTIVISDELEKRLREYLRRTGRIKRGALSSFIENAIRVYLDYIEYSDKRFYAEKDGEVVAKASSLRELANKLRNLNIDPRSVRIYSVEMLRSGRKIGLRGSRL
ncbi:MAG: hypothetical protein DRJ32_00985 [Thermoprotei archaeon]|nr:MAG: hypothetical protein DRJ32_00985 [Thermoprotei archaeon]RLE71876.1 MAG: hypothetical protein DRZ80_07905 [Thermoprotei archaeon]HDD64066.1 hypothetical protein [Thermoprotei archaeon]